ncbi:MAG: hypothetical protein KIB45_06575 [Negativicoccus succinicivorans]|uniref:DNA methyltransferase n=1 Tax=Negativicoccus succinicivorans TaxID=620903 RepID=UPI002354E7E6|nr:DNA methyltransferase [Negativicoccus succinicivorans]MBS5890730.1 hypothetical protein [Negativicoccus succinicivorans]
MSYKSNASSFLKNPKYKEQPYSKRNWGHPWHSLCSYHGKLKPAIAAILIKEFTKPGDLVLDPLCGVGTIPFEASLQGRNSIGNDLSELAYTVTTAKLNPPNIEDVEKKLVELESFITDNKFKQFDADIDFGLNGKIKDYYHEDTLKEILIVREYFKSLETKGNVDAFIFSCFAHILHGNRPYALSRNSHPLTPYAPKGAYLYKNVIEHIRNKVYLSYNKSDKYLDYERENFVIGSTYNLDYNDLLSVIPKDSVNAIITSPPFSNSIKFYSQNWLRLWLSGWERSDFQNVNDRFLEIKQRSTLDVYKNFFKVGHALLKDGGKMILHLGKTSKVNMGEELSKLCRPWFDVIYLGSESVSHLEKHGIKDKGGTSDHQYLFLIKKNNV